MKGVKSLVLCTLLVGVVIITLPLVVQAARPGFDDKEIRIGSFAPLTGPAAPWGAVGRGSGFLFDIVNDEGGIHGRKINYILRDDQYNPAQTKAVVKEMVERKGIIALVGGVGAAGGMAVKGYLAQNKIIWVSPSTAVNEYVFPVDPYLFAVYPLFQDEASILTKFAVEKLKAKKIAFLYQNDIYGKSGLEGCTQRLDAMKLKLVEEIPVEPTEKDLSSQMLRLKNSGADVAFMWVNPTTAVIALKTCATIGYKPQWISSDTLLDYPLMNKITGGLWEGVITGSFGVQPYEDHPLMNKYRSIAKQKVPEERWCTSFTAGILYAEPLVDALKRVGPKLSTSALLKALNSTKNFQGIGPSITWTPMVHQGADALQIVQCGPNSSHILLQNWTSNDLANWKKK